MTDFKGTKGKWRVFRTPTKNQDGRYQTSVVSKIVVDSPICCVWGKTKDQCENNAKLISKAPELLNALEEIIHAFENNALTSVEFAKELIQEAIV